MELTEKLIREFVIASAQDLEVEQKEINLKLDLLASTMTSNFTMLENMFRCNFPNLPIHNFGAMCQPSISNIGIDNITEAAQILKGEDYITRSFKRQIEFLKVVSGESKQAFKFDRVIDEYFHYWSDVYFQEKYTSPTLSPEALTLRPNPIESFQVFSSVIGYTQKKLINIENSDKDVWTRNKPVIYKFDHNTNNFLIETTAGHKCIGNSDTVKHVPNLDENICAAIMREYKEKFNIDYINYNSITENQFHNFIIKLINHLVFTHENLYDKIDNRYSYGYVDLCYGSPCRLSVNSDNISIVFKFTDLDHPNNENKYLEIKIENTRYKQMNISVKFNNSYQAAQYEVNKDAEEKDQLITFCGYYKQNGNDGPHLHYAKEDWKLCVLFYGKQLIDKQDDILLQIDVKISESVASRKMREHESNS